MLHKMLNKIFKYDVAVNYNGIYLDINTRTLYVNEDDATNHIVLNHIAFLRQSHAFIGDINYVPFETLKLLSSNHDILESQSQLQNEIRLLFAEASQRKASDLYITVRDNLSIVQLRIFGALTVIKQLSSSVGSAICKTIYQTMSDAASSSFQPRRSQKSRMKIAHLHGTNLNGVRIQSNPTDNGYEMICRLLYQNQNIGQNMYDLGYTANQVNDINYIMSKPSGICIIAGPTGSGKSTTLQVIITNLINASNCTKHVVTVEDPPEYPIYGKQKITKLETSIKNGVKTHSVVNKEFTVYATQIPVSQERDDQDRREKFAKVIADGMRSDPDIFMIGEIRDYASADAAINAAITGHQVFTTIHAGHAMLVLSRLVNLGIKSELICDADIVSGIIAQRLVRKLCPHCAIPLNTDEHIIHRLNTVFHGDMSNIKMRGNGCKLCDNGVSGRSVVAEVIVTDAKFMELYASSKTSALSYWKSMSGMSMMQHGLLKVKDGIVDPRDLEQELGYIEL
jgi:general secretion pathway protein E